MSIRRHIFRLVGISLLLVLLVAVGVLGWLYVTAPPPREVPGWSLGPSKPAPRGELATAVAYAEPCPQPPCLEAERLYVLGGFSGLGTVQDRVSVYAPGSRTWSPAPFLPAPRHHLAAVGMGRDVYVTGGAERLRTPWAPEQNLWRLRVGADERWQVLEPMPEPRWGHRMVAHEGRLFVVGGHGPTSRVLIYSPGKGWSTGAEMPVPRHHLSVVVVDDHLWAMGGRTDRSLSRVDRYDPASDVWLPGPDLPAPTSGAAEGVVAGVILVLGGEEDDLFTGQVYDEHWAFDTRDDHARWEPAPKPPLAVHGADGAVFQGTLYLVGGAGRHGALSVTAWTDAVQILDAYLFPGRRSPED